MKPQRPQPPQREHREPLTQALTQQWVSWLVPALIALVTLAAWLNKIGRPAGEMYYGNPPSRR